MKSQLAALLLIAGLVAAACTTSNTPIGTSAGTCDPAKVAQLKDLVTKGAEPADAAKQAGIEQSCATPAELDLAKQEYKKILAARASASAAAAATAAPSATPSATASASPTAAPSATDAPTAAPTNPPTNPPTTAPTVAPTPRPSPTPSPAPTPSPSPVAGYPPSLPNDNPCPVLAGFNCFTFTVTSGGAPLPNVCVVTAPSTPSGCPTPHYGTNAAGVAKIGTLTGAADFYFLYPGKLTVGPIHVTASSSTAVTMP